MIHSYSQLWLLTGETVVSRTLQEHYHIKIIFDSLTKFPSTHSTRQDANSWHVNFSSDAQSVNTLQRHPVVIVQHVSPIHCNLKSKIVI